MYQHTSTGKLTAEAGFQKQILYIVKVFVIYIVNNLEKCLVFALYQISQISFADSESNLVRETLKLLKTKWLKCPEMDTKTGKSDRFVGQRINILMRIELNFQHASNYISTSLIFYRICLSIFVMKCYPIGPE